MTNQRGYDLARRVFAVMDVSKPVALATLSQRTGVRLAELIQLAKRLEAEKLFKRVTDNGNTFYILLEKVDDARLEEIFLPPEPTANKPMSSRDAIMKRRRTLREQTTDTNPTPNQLSSENITPMTGARLRRQKTSGPEPLSAVDLLAMRRSSTTSPRTLDLNRASGRLSRMSSGSDFERYSSPNATNTNLRSSDVFRNPASSASNKAVFINHPVPRGMGNSRSTFAPMPPAELDNGAFERSDGSFKQINPGETRSQMPLIPLKAMPQTNNDVTEADVRKTLGIDDDFPLLTILSPRPCHEVWKSCSALANVGGGILVLGMRKYVHDNNVTYYIKSIASPEESIKQLLKAFNDRSLISDCPKDPNFIETKEFGRKTVLVLRIDPSQLAPAPLFTSRDSFGMRTTNGCYIYRNGEAVHCTEDEIKALWIRLRAGNEEIDWDQTSEQIEVPMERKVKLHLPPIIDDTVRPLSRRECTYGQALPQPDLPPNMRGYAAKPDIRNQPDHLPLYPTAADFLKETIQDVAQHQAQNSTPETSVQNKASNTALQQELPLETLIHEADIERPSRRIKATSSTAQTASSSQTVNSLLFAEDIRAAATSANNTAKSHPSNSAVPTQISDSTSPASSTSMPPKLADADRAKLDEIAAPAINHPRLPTARLCEIAITLCKHARLKPAELAEILNRKLVPIRDRVMPKIKEHPDVHCVDGIYYYIGK